MKRSSPFQIVLLAVFGALGVAGVLIFALVVGGGNTTSVGQVTVWGTFDESRIQAVLRAAAETDDRLTGVTYVRKDSATYESDLVNALASGTGPDLFFLRDDWALYDSAKTIHISPAQMSETQFRNTFLDAALPFLAADGAMAVPLVADPLVMYWNKDIFASANLATPPVYWNDFGTLGPKLTVQKDSGVITRSAFALGEYQNIANAKGILSTLIMQAGGAVSTRDATGKVQSGLSPQQGGGSQPSLAALRFYTDFADPAKEYYSWNRALPEARTAFAQGIVAVYIGYASEAILIKQANPNLNFSMAPVPQLRDAGTPKNYAHVYALAIPRTAKNPQGGLTVAYIFAAPIVSQGFASVLGMASALRGVVASASDTLGGAPAGSLQAVLASAPKSTQDLINSQAAIALSWYDPDPLATADIFRAMIEDTVSGAQKAQDALGRADKSFNQLLGI
jgi:ABC-type glycerol-3-phosphate transport system substrate-binding protein